MKYRKLRIAWSVAWGVFSLLLVVLWVRSYRGIDVIEGPLPGNMEFGAESRTGEMVLGFYGSSILSHWEIHTYTPAYRWSNGPYKFSAGPPWRYGWVLVPFELPIFLILTAAVVPWVRWSSHFSLRTLLIGMTTLAALLGAVAWYIR